MLQLYSWCTALYAVTATAAAHNNMNNHNYTIANPTPTTPLSIPFHGEYFEVLGPETTTHYSQVYWKSQPVALPPHIVSRFNTSIMAVTGMEVDIVRSNANGTTTSVECFQQYNHHYSGWMYGKHASPKEQAGSDDNPIVGAKKVPLVHGHPLPQWTVVQPSNAINYPNVQGFSEGNGNEHRGAYKGYAKGFAQLIRSPITWANNPMIISESSQKNQTLERQSLEYNDLK